MRYLILFISLSIIYSLSYSQSQTNEEAIVGNNKFCINLLKQTYEQGENTAFSPLSISSAFAMTYDGAAWRTKRDIRKTMNFSFSKKKNHDNWVSLIKEMQKNSDNFLQIANAVWAQEDYGFSDEFTAGLQEYGARVKYVDFRDQDKREMGRIDINKWVEKRTSRMIEELIQPDNIDELTRMVIVNAVYFKEVWEKAFNEKLTMAQDFFLSDSNPVAVDFLKQPETETLFCEKDDYSAVRLPYNNEVAEMIIILPAENIMVEDILKDFDLDKLSKIEKECKLEKINLSIPKFDISARYEMKNTLREMGMIAPFADYANFKPMNGKKNLLIDDVIHETVIKVDESGTEASASTAVIMREKSAGYVADFHANRPFMFFIKENQNGIILFSGIVENPYK